MAQHLPRSRRFVSAWGLTVEHCRFTFVINQPSPCKLLTKKANNNFHLHQAAEGVPSPSGESSRRVNVRRSLKSRKINFSRPIVIFQLFLLFSWCVGETFWVRVVMNELFRRWAYVFQCVRKLVVWCYTTEVFLINIHIFCRNLIENTLYWSLKLSRMQCVWFFVQFSETKYFRRFRSSLMCRRKEMKSVKDTYEWYFRPCHYFSAHTRIQKKRKRSTKELFLYTFREHQNYCTRRCLSDVEW